MKRIALLIAICAPLSAFAQIDGNFLASCRKDQSAGLDHCRAYIVGVIDGINALATAKNLQPPYCIPAGVSGSQVRDIAVDFSRNHVSIRHLPAVKLIPMSLEQAFPC